MTTDLNIDSKITKEALERARARIGEKTALIGGFNTEVQLDMVRHWAEGIGDDNPLWLDSAYAAKTRHGTILVPPSYLQSVRTGPMWHGRSTGGFRGFPGVHRFWASDKWEWFVPMKHGDVGYP
ncbi:MAG: MaoC family dehydratase [Chloroflexi bacterium]|nr:MaoC family dehydratase [Chloroflexota bacterium]